MIQLWLLWQKNIEQESIQSNCDNASKEYIYQQYFVVCFFYFRFLVATILVIIYLSNQTTQINHPENPETTPVCVNTAWHGAAQLAALVGLDLTPASASVVVKVESTINNFILLKQRYKVQQLIGQNQQPEQCNTCVWIKAMIIQKCRSHQKITVIRFISA